jgi:hypothetical protein
MLIDIFGALVLAAVLGAIGLMIVCGIDTALRERYERHAERKYREKYRRWCAQTPVQVDKRLTFICGKGYKDDAA